MKTYRNYIILLILMLALSLMLPAAAENKAQTNPFSQIKFMPALSFIMDFSYVRRNMGNELYSALETPGFFEANHPNDEGGHNHGTLENGFNFNYGELVLFAAVDPYFDLFTSFHLSEGSFEIEEAYATTRRLPYGLGLKIGKFFSALGRQNGQHGHIWDFNEKPLVLRAFLGDEGLAEKGIQLNWVAPTNFYLALGIETLQGSNETSFGTTSFRFIHADSAAEINVEEPALPNLWTFFGKTSLEWGNLVVLAGAAYSTGKTRSNHLDEEHEPHAFAGHTTILGLDVYAKYILDSHRYFSFQGEFLARRKSGELFTVLASTQEAGEETPDRTHENPEVAVLAQNAKQAGWYGQLVVRFHRFWRLGVRADSLFRNHITQNGEATNLPKDFYRYSVMLDYSPTEFTRFRVQYNRNGYQVLTGEKKPVHEFLIQLNLAIGAHGAHTF